MPDDSLPGTQAVARRRGAEVKKRQEEKNVEGKQRNRKEGKKGGGSGETKKRGSVKRMESKNRDKEGVCEVLMFVLHTNPQPAKVLESSKFGGQFGVLVGTLRQ